MLHAGRTVRVLTTRVEAVEASVRARDEFVAILSDRGQGGIPTDVKRHWWPLAYEHQQEETQRWQ